MAVLTENKCVLHYNATHCRKEKRPFLSVRSSLLRDRTSQKLIDMLCLWKLNKCVKYFLLGVNSLKNAAGSGLKQFANLGLNLEKSVQPKKNGKNSDNLSFHFDIFSVKYFEIILSFRNWGNVLKKKGQWVTWFFKKTYMGAGGGVPCSD